MCFTGFLSSLSQSQVEVKSKVIKRKSLKQSLSIWEMKSIKAIKGNIRHEPNTINCYNEWYSTNRRNEFIYNGKLWNDSCCHLLHQLRKVSEVNFILFSLCGNIWLTSYSRQWFFKVTLHEFFNYNQPLNTP